jgi:hypothetical protein
MAATPATPATPGSSLSPATPAESAIPGNETAAEKKNAKKP